GFPYGIGCGLAGGDWNEYKKLLEGFAEQVSVNGVAVILYRLNCQVSRHRGLKSLTTSWTP
ncbi:MAG: hypothetical protein ACREVA_09710, partial [Burkholderiales bacterium]